MKEESHTFLIKLWRMKQKIKVAVSILGKKGATFITEKEHIIHYDTYRT